MMFPLGDVNCWTFLKGEVEDCMVLNSRDLNKFRQLRPTNRIINSSDSKPSEFERRFSDDSDFNVTIGLPLKYDFD